MVCGGPVEPGGRVVLAIGIVVALLAVADLVAGTQHGRALRQRQRGQHGAAYLAALRVDAGIIRGPLDAKVGAHFPIPTIAVVFPVGVVVLLVVAHDVGQCVAVVNRQEINRGRRTALAVMKQVAGCGQAACGKVASTGARRH